MGENEPMSVDGVELKSASPPPDPSDTSHTDAFICDTVDTESVLGGNGVELKNPPQSESEPALFDNNVDFNVQAVANNGVEDFNISSQEPQVQPMLNDVKDSNFESSGENTELKSGSEQPREGSSPPTLSDESKSLLNPGTELSTEGKTDANNSTTDAETAGVTADAKPGSSEVLENKSDNTGAVLDEVNPQVESPSIKTAVENTKELKTGENNENIETPKINGNSSPKLTFLLEEGDDGSESGTEEEQSAFVKELEKFFRGKGMDFKPPKFYGEVLNCLKLWRSVMRLGGYDKVTSSKLWRIIGESFKPPKTCTTVSWTFRGFYEKTLLEYERQKTRGGEIVLPDTSHSEPIGVENQTPGSGRARRDAAARAMQCWHSRLHGNGEASDTTLKDKNSLALQKQEKSVASLKRRKPTHMEDAVKAARAKTSKAQLDVDVVDLGSPADWVKINVQRNKDCFEVYALVPGLLREEVRVQSDPAGRLVISGEPEQPDNPWGVTPFRKVVTLPGRIDPHHTSAVVTLHGQLFVRVPFEQSG